MFCGRVFIFLFQSFPLGDRSSVNLRGEYHTENVTVYETLPNASQVKDEDNMDVDQQGENSARHGQSASSKTADSSGQTVEPSINRETQITSTSENVRVNGEDGENSQEKTSDMDALYPKFWFLQESFSTPTRLFEETNLQSFKDGLESTMHTFKEVHQELAARGISKLPDDTKRGVKRKRNEQEDEFSASFNPKYLTSRDLFDLEISDLAFRRHVLVQALILIDFLLSLTAKAKKKLGATSNKSVLYSYTLTEDNAKWATNMRNEIATYLQQGQEGKFYYRMVDTVLSRDKNWVHWKAEGCPPIQREPVSAEDFADSETGATRACANKRLKSTPLGTLDLTFLSDNGDTIGMEALKNPERYSIPTAESFERPIADDDFEIEMAKTNEEKQLAIDAKASKLWRALRIASKNKLNRFDKIDDGNNLKALFEPDGDESRKGDVNGSSVSDENNDSAAKTVEAPATEEKQIEGHAEASQEMIVT